MFHFVEVSLLVLRCLVVVEASYVNSEMEFDWCQ